MKIYWFILLFILLKSNSLFAQPGIPSNPSQAGTFVDPSGTVQLKGSFLINYLRDYYYYTNSSGKSYDNSRQYLYSKVDISGDQVYGLYTGFTATYDSSSATTASTQVYQGGVGINAEHLWPQSKFSEASPMVFDLHHLYAAKVQANGDRSNYPFMNIPENEVTYWYLGSDRLTSAPATQDQYLYSKYKSNTGFEPRDSTKGDVARAIFYFYAMYKDNANMLAQVDNQSFFDGMKATLYEWHKLDAVSTQESERNDKVEVWQGNRNPFTDDSSLVYLSFFAGDGISVNYAGASSGWRMAGLPFGISYADAYDSFWTQGFTGSDNSTVSSTIYEWNTSSASFESITNASESATNHKGHIIYFFQDDDPLTSGIQGNFPKSTTISNGTIPTSATFQLHAPDLNTNLSNDSNEGWNLLQNPFDRPISVTDLLTYLESESGLSLNQNVYIWSADNNSYSTLASGENASISPFQAFWVKSDEIASSETAALIERNTVQTEQEAPLRKERTFPEINIKAFSKSSIAESRIRFNETSLESYDKYDAFYLEPLNSSTIQVYSSDIDGNAYQNQCISENFIGDELFIPVYLSEFDGKVQIESQISSLTELDAYWVWNNQEYHLTKNNLEFTVSSSSQSNLNESEVVSDFASKKVLKSKSISNTQHGIKFKKKSTTSNERLELPSSFTVSEAFPNPFNPSTNFSIQANKAGLMQWEVYSSIGKKVQSGQLTISEGSTNFHLTMNENVASGLYFVRMRFNGNQQVLKRFTFMK